MSASCPQLGFEVTFHLDTSVDATASTDLRAAFTTMLDARGLSTHGSAIGVERWHCIIWREGSQAEHADREAVREWSEHQRHIVSVSIGDLIDIDFADRVARPR